MKKNIAKKMTENDSKPPDARQAELSRIGESGIALLFKTIDDAMSRIEQLEAKVDTLYYKTTDAHREFDMPDPSRDF